MQKIIQIYPCLLKLSRKQDTILKISDFSTKKFDFPPKPLLQIFPCKNPSKIMIITSHTQKFFQIHPCLLKLSCKQESVTDRRTNSLYYYIPHRYHGGGGGDKNGSCSLLVLSYSGTVKATTHLLDLI